MRLWKCTVCGKIALWGKTWGCFSSLAIDEEYPSLRIVGCSKACMDISDAKLESGEWALPKLRLASGGYTMHLSKPQKGYQEQPTQVELLTTWNERSIEIHCPS